MIDFTDKEQPEKPSISTGMLAQALLEIDDQIEKLLEDALGTPQTPGAPAKELNFLGILTHAQQALAVVRMLEDIVSGKIKLSFFQAGEDSFYPSAFVWYLPDERKIIITEDAYLWPAHTKVQRLGKFEDILSIPQDERAAQ